MLALCGLTLLSVNSSHAFFQPEQALIDLCTFCLAVFVVGDAVGRTLAASQIHEKQLAAVFDTFFLYLDLTDRMASRGSVIGDGGMGRAHFISLINQIDNLLLRRNELLAESLNLYFLVFVLQYFERLVIVQKVKDFIAVDFVHGNSDCKVPLVVLPVVNTALKQVLNRQVLESLHCECFPGTSLAISKDSQRASVEDIVEDGS